MSTQTQKHDLTRPVVLCAIYLRISLDSTGEGLGVARQRADCERIARERGWSVFEVYEDNSISAYVKRKKRPAYDRMQADFAAGKFSAIVVWDLDRLTRQPRQLEDWVDAAENTSLVLVTANGDADLSTDGGQMYARIKAAVARAEMDRKSKRQKAANAQRLESGYLYRGTRVTGYTNAGEVIEQEAKVVRRIFDAFENGESVKGITEGLQADGIPTRTDIPWSRSSVHDILTNAKYAGRQTLNRVPTGKAGSWVAIIKEEQFDAVQVQFQDPARRRLRKGTDRRYLGSGLFLCGVCQREVQVYGNGPTYGCTACGRYKSVKPVDKIVLKAITDRLSKPDVLSMLSPRDDERMRALTAKVTDLRRRLSKIEADYDAGYVDGKRYNVASGKVQADLSATEKQRATLMAGNSVGALLTAPDPAQLFLDAPVTVQRHVLDALLWVVLEPTPDGKKRFVPETVSVRWRRSLATSGLVVLNDSKPIPIVREQDVHALA